MGEKGEGDVQSAILLRGAPGVGKSTVGRLVVDFVGSGALVEVDTVRAMFGGLDWSNRRQHDIALLASLRLAESLARQAGSPIVLGDTFTGGRLELAERTLRESGIPFITVSLWADGAELLRRARSRNKASPNVEMILGTNEEVVVRLPPAGLLIDTTRQSAEAVARQVYADWREVRAKGPAV